MKRMKAILMIVGNGLGIILYLMLVGIAGLFLYLGFTSRQNMHAYDHLEENAKKAITGNELQTWATNLLAHHPEGLSLIVTNLPPDFPKQLLKLCSRMDPDIFSNPVDDTNSPPCLYITWGSGFLGHSGFELGPTNLVSYYPNSHVWQPGVYFFKH